jgi:hypothetical protein
MKTKTNKEDWHSSNALPTKASNTPGPPAKSNPAGNKKGSYSDIAIYEYNYVKGFFNSNKTIFYVTLYHLVSDI